MRTYAFTLAGILVLTAGCSSSDDDTDGSGGASSTGGAPSTGGAASSGGTASSGGATTGGVTSAGGSGGSESGGTSSSGGANGSGGGTGELAKFSFFVTSQVGMVRLAGTPNGFGGDLRHGKATGLEGADAICTEIAESSMPGAGAKQWRAFLSVLKGPGGVRVDAIDRIGEGPWYDRLGRVVALNKAALLHDRPEGADSAIANDLPNESGIPNHRPDTTKPAVDNHHILTGSGTDGRLYQGNANGTCAGWETTATTAGRPRIGFSWIAGGRTHWISGQDEGGCGAGVNIAETGGSNPNNPIVGSGGGYGGIYCFALTP